MGHKRILFIRARKKTDNYAVPHLGIGLLSAVLQAHGHKTLALDYLLFLDKTPPFVEDIIMNFDPDIVSFSIYTSTASESIKIINEVKKITTVPILIGGPHATLYADELAARGIGDYIVKGEGETVICNIVEKATPQIDPVIIEAPRPGMSDIPFPDFTSFLNYERIEVYPLQTSRGCPYQCRFCAVKFIATRKWRAREVDTCIEELRSAKQYLPRLKTVKIVDDAPTTNENRFKDFLKKYIAENIRLEMIIDNIRADSVNTELISLARRAGCNSLCIAVEHADPEVFAFVNKGESLEQIAAAAAIIKKAGLDLGLCFIIGLPYDNFEKTLVSARFAIKLKADFIYWNMSHPMKGTELSSWYKANGGTFYPDEDYTSFDYHTLKSPDPVIETGDFSRENRKRAYFAANALTGQFPVNLREIYYLCRYGIYYNLPGLALTSLIRRIVFLPQKVLKYAVRYIRRGLPRD